MDQISGPQMFTLGDGTVFQSALPSIAGAGRMCSQARKQTMPTSVRQKATPQRLTGQRSGTCFNTELHIPNPIPTCSCARMHHSFCHDSEHLPGRHTVYSLLSPKAPWCTALLSALPSTAAPHPLSSFFLT